MKVVINVRHGGFGLSKRAVLWMAKRGHEGARREVAENTAVVRLAYTWHYGDGARHDPLLVECVEKLGKKAWGQHAELKVVEIPDGVEYSIEEYDGREHVAERHRTWS